MTRIDPMGRQRLPPRWGYSHCEVCGPPAGTPARTLKETKRVPVQKLPNGVRVCSSCLMNTEAAGSKALEARGSSMIQDPNTGVYRRRVSERDARKRYGMSPRQFRKMKKGLRRA